jgi:hypothetical protein
LVCAIGEDHQNTTGPALFRRLVVRGRPVEEHRRLSFIAFGGPWAKAGLSPGWAS